MEADIRPVRGQLVCLKGVHMRPVGDRERDSMLAQERVRVLDEPGRVAELDAVAQLTWQQRERVREPFVVSAERRRELPEDRSELGGRQQRLDALEKTLEARAELA